MFRTLAGIVPAVTPVPVPPSGVDENLVTPGVLGFVFTALVALAVVLLVIDMVRRVRRLRYRVEIREKLEAEAAEADAAG